MKDLQTQIIRHSQNNTSDTMTGIYKGIVIDVRDPSEQGRVRVHIYSLHGDFVNVNVDLVPWCEVLSSSPRSYMPPEIWDRAVVSFEGGDKQAPMVIGYWRANPAGRGQLPYSHRVGSEIRPEAMHNRGLYPEVLMLGCSGQGNAAWIESKFLSGSSLASLIQLEDTGGKQVRVRSFHPTASQYSVDKAASGVGALVGANYPLVTPTRDGFSPVVTPVAGAIEFFQQNLARMLQSSSTSFSVEVKTQFNNQTEVGVDEYSVGGDIYRARQGQAALSLMDNWAALTSPVGVLLSNTFIAPRIWP